MFSACLENFTKCLGRRRPTPPPSYLGFNPKEKSLRVLRMSLKALTNSDRNPELANGYYGIFANRFAAQLSLYRRRIRTYLVTYSRRIVFIHDLADV